MTGPTATATDDRREMAAALSLARRAGGTSAPNPAVGCTILDASGRMAGQGSTAPGGRPHAEQTALTAAGDRAAGGTAYVTLEPCSHDGATPACAHALVRAGLSRVVIATRDPDPRVAGNGVSALREAGLEVAEGVGAAEARRLNAGFFLRQGRGRPAITAKVASTLDGRIATSSGASRWITGGAARRWAHALRARSDAVLVGTGTALADDPMLDCRIPGLRRRSPVRVVLDGKLRLPPTAKLIATASADRPTWLVTRDDHRPADLASCRRAGVTLLPVPADAAGRPALAAALRALAELGINDLMVEGGGTLIAALAQSGFIDNLAWVAAPRLMGGDGLPAVAGLGLTAPDEAPIFEWLDSTPLGEDRLVRLQRRGLDEDLDACLPA